MKHEDEAGESQTRKRCGSHTSFIEVLMCDVKFRDEVAMLVTLKWSQIMDVLLLQIVHFIRTSTVYLKNTQRCT
jgi:hypothetical protein